MQERLTSADRVFEVLGGVQAVMELAGAKYTTVHEWKSSGSFPSNTYVVLVSELERRGFEADPALWKMRVAS